MSMSIYLYIFSIYTKYSTYMQELAILKKRIFFCWTINFPKSVYKSLRDILLLLFKVPCFLFFWPVVTFQWIDSISVWMLYRLFYSSAGYISPFKAPAYVYFSCHFIKHINICLLLIKNFTDSNCPFPFFLPPKIPSKV